MGCVHAVSHNNMLINTLWLGCASSWTSYPYLRRTRSQNAVPTIHRMYIDRQDIQIPSHPLKLGNALMPLWTRLFLWIPQKLTTSKKLSPEYALWSTTLFS